tara:strand:- start:146 stop:343 length:198 start_codon:yes stop_codon:yes gene_type:complete
MLPRDKVALVERLVMLVTETGAQLLLIMAVVVEQGLEELQEAQFASFGRALLGLSHQLTRETYNA